MAYWIVLILALVLQASVMPAGIFWVGLYVGALFGEPKTMFAGAAVLGFLYDVARVGRLGLGSMMALLVVAYSYWLARSGGNRNLGRDLVVFIPVAIADTILIGGGLWRLVLTILFFVLWYEVVAYGAGARGEIKVRREW